MDIFDIIDIIDKENSLITMMENDLKTRLLVCNILTHVLSFYKHKVTIITEPGNTDIKTSIDEWLSKNTGPYIIYKDHGIIGTTHSYTFCNADDAVRFKLRWS